MENIVRFRGKAGSDGQSNRVYEDVPYLVINYATGQAYVRYTKRGAPIPETEDGGAQAWPLCETLTEGEVDLFLRSIRGLTESELANPRSAWKDLRNLSMSANVGLD